MRFYNLLNEALFDHYPVYSAPLMPGLLQPGYYSIVGNGTIDNGQHGAWGALSIALSADRYLSDLRSLREEIADDQMRGWRLADRLRATAEQDTELPCIVFNLASASGSLTRAGWALHKTDVLQYVTRAGTTGHVACSSHQPPWSDDALQRARATLAEAEKQVLAVKAAALRLLRLLVSRQYGFAGSVPPHESSPCGVLRLAAPIVPGAPALRSWTHQTTMALAA